MNFSNLDNHAEKLAQTVDHFMTATGEKMEKTWHSGKDWFPNKYLTRPLYKTCVSRVGPMAATAISFLSADLVMHQLMPQAARCIYSNTISSVMPSVLNSSLDVENSCIISWSPVATALWTCMAIPVMYAKYRRTIED